MRFRTGMKIVVGAAALVLLAQAPLSAQTLFYNGSTNGVTALSSEKNGTVDHSMVFDDFTVTGAGWTITGLFGDFISDLTWSDATYEIRSGVSTGNGGSLLFSGTTSVTQTDLGASPFGYETYRAGIGGLSIFLNPGTYWMGITVNSPDVGRAFLETTSGAGGVNQIHDGISYFNSTFSFFPANFGSTSDQTGEPSDFSYGILGTDGSPADNVTPEPASMTLLATGLIGLAGVPLRKRRRS